MMTNMMIIGAMLMIGLEDASKMNKLNIRVLFDLCKIMIYFDCLIIYEGLIFRYSKKHGRDQKTYILLINSETNSIANAIHNKNY